METAQAVKAAGAHACAVVLQAAHVFWFPGDGRGGLRLLAEAREITGLPVVTEVMSPDQGRLCRRMLTSCRLARAARGLRPIAAWWGVAEQLLLSGA